MENIREDCFFWMIEGRGYLYGCIHLPLSAYRSTGVVIAPPIGRERLRSYRELVNLSRALASKGYPVFRFDYRGEGESSGSFDSSDISSRVEDIIAAVSVFRERMGAGLLTDDHVSSDINLCLIGIREGALLALLANDTLKAKKLIFCEPITKPKLHAKNLLRSNIVLQNRYFGKTDDTVKTLREKLHKGESTSVYGFQTGASLINELESIDPVPYLERFDGNAALIYFAPKDVAPKRDLAMWKEKLQLNGQCETICNVFNFSWVSRKIWTTNLGLFNESVINWLQHAPLSPV